jgi:hypothetical protein
VLLCSDRNYIIPIYPSYSRIFSKEEDSALTFQLTYVAGILLDLALQITWSYYVSDTMR